MKSKFTMLKWTLGMGLAVVLSKCFLNHALGIHDITWPAFIEDLNSDPQRRFGEKVMVTLFLSLVLTSMLLAHYRAIPSQEKSAANLYRRIGRFDVVMWMFLVLHFASIFTGKIYPLWDSLFVTVSHFAAGVLAIIYCVGLFAFPIPLIATIENYLLGWVSKTWKTLRSK